MLPIGIENKPSNFPELVFEPLIQNHDFANPLVGQPLIHCHEQSSFDWACTAIEVGSHRAGPNESGPVLGWLWFPHCRYLRLPPHHENTPHVLANIWYAARDG